MGGGIVESVFSPFLLALATLAVPPTLQNVHTVVFLGDSITAGGERPGGYVWLVRHNLNALYPQENITVYNAGISGHKSSDMLARFDRDVLSHKPDLVFISVGVNDVWHGFYDNHPKGDGTLGIPLDQYKANVNAMINKAYAAHSKVFLMLTTVIKEDLGSPENEKAVSYNNALRQLSKDRGTGLVDLQSAFKNYITHYQTSTHKSDNCLTTDGVHMLQAGNALMAKTVLESLGIAPSELAKVEPKVEADRKAQTPEAGPLPSGEIVSTGKPTTASSVQPGFPPESAVLAKPDAKDRWCAKDGNFNPTPWWQVDLGEVRTLKGVHLAFAPNDTWRYQVLVSSDGIGFDRVVDADNSNLYIDAMNHIFAQPVLGRYVKIIFTRPTAESNWPSLHEVHVYASK